jgi:stress response protein SCP2
MVFGEPYRPVSIYDADARSQTFGQVSDAYIRVLNQSDGSELARYDLTEDASTETAIVFGELTATAANGSSGPWGRGTRPVCAASP